VVDPDPIIKLAMTVHVHSDGNKSYNAEIDNSQKEYSRQSAVKEMFVTKRNPLSSVCWPLCGLYSA
jgi:hypothetical protein